MHQRDVLCATRQNMYGSGALHCKTVRLQNCNTASGSSHSFSRAMVTFSVPRGAQSWMRCRWRRVVCGNANRRLANHAPYALLALWLLLSSPGWHLLLFNHAPHALLWQVKLERTCGRDRTLDGPRSFCGEVRCVSFRATGVTPRRGRPGWR